MKKLGLILALIASTNTFAYGGFHGYYHPSPHIYVTPHYVPHYGGYHPYSGTFRHGYVGNRYYGRFYPGMSYGGGWLVPFLIGGVLGYAIADNAPQPDQQPIVIDPNYPPFPGAEPVYGQVYMFIPQCNCYQTVSRQVGWR